MVLYGHPVPPAMVPPLLRTYGDGSASSSAATGDFLVFISLEFLSISFTMFLRDPTFSGRSRGLSPVGGTPILLTKATRLPASLVGPSARCSRRRNHDHGASRHRGSQG